MIKIKQTPEIIQNIISTYLSGLDTNETAQKHNCSATFVINVLKRNDISRRSTQMYTRKYITRENFF